MSSPTPTTAVSPSNPSAAANSNRPSAEGTWAALEPSIQQNIGVDDMIWTDLGPNTFLDFDTFLDPDSQAWMNVAGPIIDPIFEDDSSVNERQPLSSTLTMSPAILRAQQADDHIVDKNCSSMGFWHGSPIRLLNSTASAQQTTRNLYQIYDTMMIGVATRYLSHSSNHFAGSFKYEFKADYCADELALLNQGDPHTLTSLTTSAPSHNVQLTPASSARQPHEGAPESLGPITLIGVARFLDNFGSLYGNQLDRKKRKQDEDTLIAVLQVFALQFSAPDDVETGVLESPSYLVKDSPGARGPTTKTQLYTAAWFNAHSYLTESINTRSFVHLYAVILFHIAGQPEEARSMPEYAGCLDEFLDRSLHQLESLSALVESFCSRLDSKSLYRTLLDSSRRVLFWFAYVRDTMTSFVKDRPCILKDGPLAVAEYAPQSSFLPTLQSLEETMAETCQCAKRFVFSVFRQICSATSLLSRKTEDLDQSAIIECLRAMMDAIEKFSSTHDDWLDQCQSNFLQLSTQSKQFAGFFIIFWNMGLLRFVEVVEQASKKLDSMDCIELTNAAYKYRQKAIRACAGIVRLINEASRGGGFRITELSESEVPFISHHANTGITVMALQKTIEHTIYASMPAKSGSSAYGAPQPVAFLPEEARESLQPLLAGLSTLLQSISGQCTARPALEELMQRHGDILLDCWNQDLLYL